MRAFPGLAGSVTATLAVAALLILVAAPLSAQSPSPAATDEVATPTPSPSIDPMTRVEVALSDFIITPDTVELFDASVAFAVENEGITPHNLSIRDGTGTLVAATPTLSQGESSDLLITLPAPGTYTIFCSLPGHESLGMSGRVVVAPPAAPEAGVVTVPASPEAGPDQP